MSWRRAAPPALLALTLAGAALAARGTAPPPPVKRLATPATFPAGDGSAIAERSCVICHSPMLVTQQAKDSSAWLRTVSQMEKWGVSLTPEERDTLVRWLARELPPRPSR
jgi:mono/diheme cytochrome c family protein